MFVSSTSRGAHQIAGWGRKSPPVLAQQAPSADSVTISQAARAASKEKSENWLSKGLMLTVGAASMAGAFAATPAQAQVVEMTQQQSQACTLYTYLHNGGGVTDRNLDTLGIQDRELLDLAKKAEDGAPRHIINAEERLLKALVAPKVTKDCPSFGTSVYYGS